MPVRIAIGMAVTVIALAVAGRRFHWLSPPDPRRPAGARPGTRQHLPARPRPSSTRSPGSASSRSGPFPGSPTSSRCGASRSCCSRSSRPTAASSEGLPHPGHRHLVVARVPRGLLHRRGPGGLGHLHGHPAQERPGPQGALQPLLRLPHRGGVAGPAMIAAVMVTLLLYRAAQVDTKATHSPTARLGLRVPRGRQRAAPAGERRSTASSSHGLPHPQHRRDHRLPRLRGVLEAPAHLPGADQRGVLPAAARARRRSTRRRTWTWRT